jgi:hypothetical protein
MESPQRWDRGHPTPSQELLIVVQTPQRAMGEKNQTASPSLRSAYPTHFRDVLPSV